MVFGCKPPSEFEETDGPLLQYRTSTRTVSGIQGLENIPGIVKENTQHIEGILVRVRVQAWPYEYDKPEYSTRNIAGTVLYPYCNMPGPAPPRSR